MYTTRRLIAALGSAVGLWVLASFAGTMLDPANASVWTTSLMWSLLAGLSVAPALLLLNHASVAAGSDDEARREPSVEQESSAEQEPSAEQESFVEENRRPNKLWPEPEQQSSSPVEHSAEEEWPSNRTEAHA